jgi:CheY-like chemotaxis protein
MFVSAPQPGEQVGGREARGPVLVVDDDPGIRTLVVEAIAEEGYPVLGVADGSEALAAVALGPTPCVVLLDMQMPVMDGWEFVSRYRERRGPWAPIVVMTAARDAAARAREVAADGVLAKPFDLADLDALVRRYCA